MIINTHRIGCLLLALTFSLAAGSQMWAQADEPRHETYLNNRLVAGKTQTFQEKEGFERKPKDIINTLKDNEVSGFSTMLDGLTQAYGLDKTLKDNGPFTFLRCQRCRF